VSPVIPKVSTTTKPVILKQSVQSKVISIPDEIDDEIGAALDEISSDSDNDSDDKSSSCNSDSGSVDRDGVLPTPVIKAVSIKHQAAVDEIQTSFSESSEQLLLKTKSNTPVAMPLQGWTKIKLEKPKRVKKSERGKGKLPSQQPQPKPILSQINHDTVHSVSTALSACCPEVVAGAVYNRIEGFAGCRSRLWDNFSEQSPNDNGEAIASDAIAAEVSTMISTLVSLLRSFVTEVPRERGIPHYRAIMFLLQNHSLSARKVCGDSRPGIEVMHSYLLGATSPDMFSQSHPEARDTAPGTHFERENKEDGVSVSLEGGGVVGDAECADDAGDATPFSHQDGDLGSVLAEIDSDGDADADGDDAMVDGTLEGDDDDNDSDGDSDGDSDIEEVPDIESLGEGEGESMDRHDAEINHDVGKDDAKDVTVVKGNTKSVRQLISFIVAAIVVETSLSMVTTVWPQILISCVHNINYYL
jgi:hypothetical protein